jgi:hypothetical protein
MPNVYEKYSFTEPNGNRLIAKVRPEVAKLRFLELYMQTAHIHKTCEILGISPRNIYRWKIDDPEFDENMRMAEQVAIMVLEDEATRRAVYGTDRPVYQGGKLAGLVREYSDALLITLLKAKAPHKYKERFSGELTGVDGKPLVPEQKIIHVHSNIPLAQSEDTIIIETTPQLNAPNDDEEDLLG